MHRNAAINRPSAEEEEERKTPLAATARRCNQPVSAAVDNKLVQDYTGTDSHARTQSPFMALLLALLIILLCAGLLLLSRYAMSAKRLIPDGSRENGFYRIAGFLWCAMGTG